MTTQILKVPELKPPKSIHDGHAKIVARGRFTRSLKGAVESRRVEVIDAARGWKFLTGPYGMKVIPADTPLFNRKTGMPARTMRTRYVSIEQSWHETRSRDALGGFTTGSYADIYPETWLDELPKWTKQGFKVAR